MTFKVTANFHPSHRVPGRLAEARAFFQRVFGRPSTGTSTFMSGDYPVDYCAFTEIRDVLFDSIDTLIFPSRLNPRPEAGNPPHLGGVAWYVDDHDALVRAFRKHGLHLLDHTGAIVESDMAPWNPLSPGAIMLTFTDAQQIGFPYEFYTVIPERRADWGEARDARFRDGWRLPEVSPDDPLAIERCAWHTLLSDQPERQLWFFTEVLGGKVIHRSANDALGLESVFVSLGDGVYELARPVTEGFAKVDWQEHFRGDDDCYHGLTFKTADLARARRHLTDCGVRLVHDADDLIVTDPRDTIGVHWGFTTELAPGDIRPPLRLWEAA